MNKPLLRQDKLKALNINIKCELSDNYIDDLYNLHITNKKEEVKQKTVVVKGKNKNKNNDETYNEKNNISENKMNKDSGKYKVLLKLINKILIGIKREEINDLLNFTSVKRTDILALDNINNLFGMSKDIFDKFDENESLWHIRESKKDYIICFLKYACDDIGLKLSSIQRTFCQNSKATRVTLYTIINNKS